jgi:hypothetical protein
MNPRVLRDQLHTFVGKKVMMGLTNLHYISCRVVGLEPTQLNVTVNGKAMQVPVDLVDNIAEAPDAQAEYVK